MIRLLGDQYRNALQRQLYISPAMLMASRSEIHKLKVTILTRAIVSMSPTYTAAIHQWCKQDLF